jgi:hypothetical protein
MASDYLRDEWQDELFQCLRSATAKQVVEYLLVALGGALEATAVSRDAAFLSKRELPIDDLLFGPPRGRLAE